MSGIDKAVERAGSQTNLARILGVTQVAVSKWRASGHVPWRRAQQIERMFGIDKAELLPPEMRWIAKNK